MMIVVYILTTKHIKYLIIYSAVTVCHSNKRKPNKHISYLLYSIFIRFLD